MSNSISIGIIIPVYRIPYDLLKACFYSLHNQSYTNIKMVFIDDCSPDECGEICDDFSQEDNRVIVIHQPENRGVSAARNIGLEVLKTDYITFVDGDDWLDNNTINDIVDWIKLQKETFDIIMYRQVMNYSQSEEEDDLVDEIVWKTNKEKTELQISAISSAVKGIKNRAMSIDNVAGKLIRRELIIGNNVRFKAIPYREDGVFFQEIVECANSVVAVPYGFYHYRMRDGSAVNSFRPNAPQEQMQLCKYMWEFAEINQKGELYKNRLYTFLLIPIQMIISTYYYHPDAKMSFIKRHRECRRFLQQKPFCDMSRYINLRELKRNSAIKYLLIRIHFYWMIYRLRELYNKKIMKRNRCQ